MALAAEESGSGVTGECRSDRRTHSRVGTSLAKTGSRCLASRRPSSTTAKSPSPPMRSCTLRGKARVATHWASCAALAEFPEVSVDAESLFVANGNLWTSAGISTGINMALAMVERDIGGVMADRIAKFMVLYSRRPGFQSQFSELLQVQAAASGDIGDLTVWMQDHLAHRLDVPTMAHGPDCPRDLSMPAKIRASIKALRPYFAV